MIICADAFDKLKKIPSKSIDTLICCMWDGVRTLDQNRLIEEGIRTVRHNIIIETIRSEEYHYACWQAYRHGLVSVDEIVWAKHQHTKHKNEGLRPRDRLENIAVFRVKKDFSFYRDIIVYTDRVTHGAGGCNRTGRRTLGNIWHGRNAWGEGKRVTKKLTNHPQPSWLIENLLYCYTPPGGSVLEVGAGVGTGWRAATKLGLPYLGFEINPEMVAAAKAWMREDPVVRIPEEALGAYMTRQATENINRFCNNQMRVIREA